MRTLIIIAAATASVLTLGSCATMSEDECLAGDWGRQGYADGRSGQPTSRLDAHTEACAKYGVVPDARSYYSAREDGLREYCTPARGFQVGREGSSYAGVCPPALEADFLPAYHDGQIVHAAEQALSSARSSVSSLGARAEDLDQKIAAKRTELRAEGLTDAQRDQIRARIDEIRREREGVLRDWRRAQDEVDDAERRVRDVHYRFADLYGRW
jgi:Spy/CpxP family protein refolding chaperone